ncbi:MAG: PEP-CTERM sorting domain-containing protein [Planctomycetota bacterium]|nr:PEP-CTERM sorting domain-containing protein [Planctomycetota bacterium]
MLASLNYLRNSIRSGSIRNGRRLCAKLFLGALVTCSLAQSGSAAVVTQWNFNVNSPGTNNSPVPSTGIGVASMVGMNSNAHNGDFPTATSGIGSSDPAISPDLSWRVRGSVSNGWSGTTSLLSGAQFTASTAGFSGISVTLDINATDGSPRYAQFMYTTDGTTFTPFGSLFDFNSTNDNWANGLSRDLSSILAVDNNPNFGFKVVSAFSPVAFSDAGGSYAANAAFQRADADPLVGPYNGTAGNYRLDMVTISAATVVPEPASLALAAIGAASMGLLVYRRKR